MTQKGSTSLSDNPVVVVIGVLAALATIISTCLAFFIFATGTEFLTDRFQDEESALTQEEKIVSVNPETEEQLILTGTAVPVATKNTAIPPPTVVLPTLTTAPIMIGKIAFVSGRDENYEIYVVNADGTDLRNLTNHRAHDDDPSWSPDGRYLAFESKRDGNLDIYIMNADGTEVRKLVDHSEADMAPAWSPDGRQVAFHSFRDGNSEIYTIDIDGRNLHRLTNNPADDWDPAWSPNGELLAFVSDRDENNEIYVMNSDGAEQRRLTESPASNTAPAWSPDGRSIAFASHGYEFGTYIMNADGTDQRLLIDQSNRRNGIAWSPDGHFIAFESLISGGWGIHVAYADGTNPREFVIGDAWGPAWSP